MAKEVICIHKGEWKIQGHIVAGPAYEETCIVVSEKNWLGSIYYELSGYSQCMFISDSFVDVTGIDAEINDALLAPEPRKHVFEPHLI